MDYLDSLISGSGMSWTWGEGLMHLLMMKMRMARQQTIVLITLLR